MPCWAAVAVPADQAWLYAELPAGVGFVENVSPPRSVQVPVPFVSGTAPLRKGSMPVVSPLPFVAVPLSGMTSVHTCDEDEANWFDWTLTGRHADVLRFASLLIGRRLMRDTRHEQQRISLNRLIHEARHAWHGVRLNLPDWGSSSRSLALTAEMRGEGLTVHLILNAYWEPLEFEIPPLPESGLSWKRWIDTALDSPDDIVPWQAAPAVSSETYMSNSAKR